jgi:transposase-like protein
MSNVKSGHVKNGSVQMKPGIEYEIRRDLIDVMLKRQEETDGTACMQSLKL